MDLKLFKEFFAQKLVFFLTGEIDYENKYFEFYWYDLQKNTQVKISEGQNLYLLLKSLKAVQGLVFASKKEIIDFCFKIYSGIPEILYAKLANPSNLVCKNSLNIFSLSPLFELDNSLNAKAQMDWVFQILENEENLKIIAKRFEFLTKHNIDFNFFSASWITILKLFIWKADFENKRFLWPFLTQNLFVDSLELLKLFSNAYIILDRSSYLEKQQSHLNYAFRANLFLEEVSNYFAETKNDSSFNSRLQVQKISKLFSSVFKTPLDTKLFPQVFYILANKIWLNNPKFLWLEKLTTQFFWQKTSESENKLNNLPPEIVIAFWELLGSPFWESTQQVFYDFSVSFLLIYALVYHKIWDKFCDFSKNKTGAGIIEQTISNLKIASPLADNSIFKSLDWLRRLSLFI